jgi:serine/threonine protein kinase
LTAHVVTRWYRAPEVCLHENYSYPIDMWSLGCILAELLHWQQGKNPICALFPGDPGHQLTAIFDIIGTPSKEDIDAVSHHSKYQDYLRKLPAKKRQDWNTLFPKASPSAIDLLDRLLTFNPNKRITAPEALAHEFLKPFHNDPVRHYTFPIAQKTMRASALQKEDEESLLQYYLAEIQVDDRSGNTKDKKVQTELHQLIFQETQKYTLNNTKRDQQQLSGVSNICASAAKAIIAAAPSPSPAAQKGTPSSFAVAIATSTPHLQAPPPVPGIAFFFADVIAKTVPQPKQPVYTPRR